MNEVPATDPLHQAFCDNVRRRRKELGLTQVQVAERLGITHASYNAIENGKAQPGLSQIRRVAVALDCTPPELLAEPVAIAR